MSTGAAPAPILAAYTRRLSEALSRLDLGAVERLAREMLACWQQGRQVFLVGNGGSAANAMHLANDYVYTVSRRIGSGLRAHALAANASVLTCLANDEGYEAVFAAQLAVMARPGDLLLAFSGRGNSPNVLRALEEGRRIGMRSHAVLGFDGGRAKALADVAIHVEVHDMQVSEDLQMAVGHMVMQWLYAQRDAAGPAPAG
jgi:D-sedoheptulose 7-phosphate isomerase